MRNKGSSMVSAAVPTSVSLNGLCIGICKPNKPFPPKKLLVMALVSAIESYGHKVMGFILSLSYIHTVLHCLPLCPP